MARQCWGSDSSVADLKTNTVLPGECAPGPAPGPCSKHFVFFVTRLLMAVTRGGVGGGVWNNYYPHFMDEQSEAQTGG